MVSPLHTEATATLEAWKPESAAQEALRQSYLGFLAAREDASERSRAAGQLTASTVVLDPAAGHVLLTLQPRVVRWLHLCGHREPAGRSLAESAMREATEESGISGLRLVPEPLHLDVHPVACSLGVPTRHFDVRFVAIGPEGARPVVSDESEELRWWPVRELPPDSEDLTELIAAALEAKP